MATQVSNRSLETLARLAKSELDRLDGDYTTFIADYKEQTGYDSNGDAYTIFTPYLYVARVG